MCDDSELGHLAVDTELILHRISHSIFTAFDDHDQDGTIGFCWAQNSIMHEIRVFNM